jgi:nucleoside-triphosphatase THEP1
VVQIFGIPGIGKSTLMRMITNYLAERNSYKGGIVYINMRSVDNIQDAIILMLNTFSAEPLNNMLSKQFSFMPSVP